MFSRKKYLLLLAAALAASSAVEAQVEPSDLPEWDAPARIVAGVAEPALRGLLVEILERNPELAAADARASAALHRAPQARALPNPMASLTGFVEPPETRTGPQEIAVGFSQAIPWFGKLALGERAALEEAESLRAEAAAIRLELVTEARRLFQELRYLDRRRVIGEELRDHFSQHEEIARARYSTGAGHGQGVVKLQAEITMAEKDLLAIRRHRISLEARLNELRDRPALTPILAEAAAGVSEIERLDLELETLIETAIRLRPELFAAAARIRQAATRRELAELSRRPDFSVGLSYTVVDSRRDLPGRLQPPAGNGDDIVALLGSVSLPIRRKSIHAKVEEAQQHEAAVAQSLRARQAEIAAEIGDLAQRLALDWRQLRLIEDLLVVQAEESEESALAGYIAGTLNALELLDAEHVRFEAHTALARARANYLIGIAELEGAIGAPLERSKEAQRP